MLKFALPPTPNPTFALPPTPTPDAGQWNIGGVGSSGIGHVYFMYISCCLCIILATRELADAKPVSSGIWALVLKHGLRLKREELSVRSSPCLPCSLIGTVQ